MNQCDGCRRGLPIVRGRVHRGEGYDIIACTAHLYQPLMKPAGWLYRPDPELGWRYTENPETVLEAKDSGWPIKIVYEQET